MAKAEIFIDNAYANTSTYTPPHPTMIQWVETALESRVIQDYEVNIKIVSKKNMRDLNRQYRKQDKATNVLSFPASIPKGVSLAYLPLGDIAICASVVNREAQEQYKQALAHWAHMLVHACLHLVGFDHIQCDEANIMENLETHIVTGMGFPPPY